MRELINMEIVGDNSSHNIGIRNSRRTCGIQFEKGDRTPSDLEEGLAPWQYEGLGAWPNQLVVESVKAAQFEEQLQLQPELDQDEEDLRQLDMLIARTLAKIVSKKNQQAI
jgi:hypothetical protein